MTLDSIKPGEPLAAETLSYPPFPAMIPAYRTARTSTPFRNPYPPSPPMSEFLATTSHRPSAPASSLAGLRFMAPGTPAPHDGVVYRSRGAVLVIGDSVVAADAARELARRAPKLRIALFAPGVGALSDLPPSITAAGGRIVSLQGHLGQFSASVRVAVDKVDDAGIFSGNADRRFDLVLDLGRERLLRQSVLPYGYYAPGSDAAALARALDSLPQLTGDFHKPGYVEYRPQLCAHWAMGVGGCTRCLDVCDTAAIRSMGEKIGVDPYLCQGCASCTLACPTGALGFQQPTSTALQRMLNELLAARADDADANVLVVHDAALRHLLPTMEVPGVLLFEVNPLSAFSDALWLIALVSGVSGVVLAMASTTPSRRRTLIECKVGELRAILASLGGDPVVLQVVTPQNVGGMIATLKSAVRPAVSTALVKGSISDEKRARVLALVDAFALSRKTSRQVGDPCQLPPGAAFGNVLVDAGKCTVCHSCVHVCPTGALSGNSDPAPVLFFRESLCVQCDLCRAGCPEKAITLQARFVPDAMARDTPRQVASDQLVPCVACGTPFIGRRKLAASLALMQEYARDLPGGLDSLKMCASCRQHATMTE